MPLKTAHHTSLKVKFAIFTAIATACIFLFLVIYVGKSQRSSAYSDSKTLALEVSRKASLETEKFLSTAFEVTRELSRNFEVLKKNKVERNILCQILTKSLEDNKDFLAIWLLWEPDAYDGKDKEYSNKDHYDLTGKLLTTYFRANGKILTEKNDIIDYQEDYYTVPKKRRHEVLIDPYDYQYRGFEKIFYETSVVVPLIYDNTFNGVVAVDINLKSLQDILNSITIYQTGYVSLISNSGIIVSHPDSTVCKKHIKDFLKGPENSKILNTVTDKEESYETISDFTGKKVLRILYPIEMGRTGTPWYTMVEIPLNEITDRSNQLLITSFIILLIGLSLLIYLTINILERRKYEKVLIDAKLKAEESERLKTAFLSNISHEIRTPMNAIVGFTELLVNKETSDDQKIIYKELVLNACNQLLFIINDILDISAIETGKISIRLSSVSMAEVIGNLKHFFEPLAMEKNIDLIFQSPYETSINHFETDEIKLIQILTNLVNNSFKFTEKGSVTMGYNIDDKYIKFYITDTGIGIKPENQEHIFDRFRQEDYGIDRKHQGVGLGLSISKAFAEILGGKIWFEANKTVGTTFYFTIPYNPIKAS